MEGQSRSFPGGGAGVVDESPDRELADRVRSTLGQHVSRPDTIAVDVRGGTVTLGGGPVPASETATLVPEIEAMSGVRAVLNHLEIQESVAGPGHLDGGGTLTAVPAHHAIDSPEDATAPAEGTEDGAYRPETI
jgi:hypothetical protein